MNPQKTLEQRAREHAESEGDNGNAEISFIAGYNAAVEIMRDEAKILVEALEFYNPGDPGNFDRGMYHDKIGEDDGDIARQAIAAYKERLGMK